MKKENLLTPANYASRFKTKKGKAVSSSRIYQLIDEGIIVPVIIDSRIFIDIEQYPEYPVESKKGGAQ